MRLRVDTAVIGAGFSGLAAGLRLAESNLEFADPRGPLFGSGGWYRLRSSEAQYPSQGGGQFVGATQPHLHAWVKRFGKPVYEVYGEGVLVSRPW